MPGNLSGSQVFTFANKDIIIKKNMQIAFLKDSQLLISDVFPAVWSWG